VGVVLVKSLAATLLAMGILTPFACAQSPTLLNPTTILHGPSLGGKAHVEINPNGTFAAFGDPNQMVQLSSLSFSDDGAFLAAGSTPGSVDLWDATHHKLLKSYEGSTAAALSSDGKLLATGEISIIDVASRKEICKSRWDNKGKAEDIVDRMSFSPSDAYLAVNANGSDISIYDAKTCKFLATLADARDGGFTPDGKQFIGANYQKLTVWGVDGWKLLSTFPAGPDYTNSFAVSPDGQTVLIGGPNYAKLVRISDGMVLRKLGTGWVLGVAYLTSDVLMVRDHNQLAFWSEDGKLLCSNTKVDGPNVAMSKNGVLAVGLGHQRDISLWSDAEVRQACHLN